MNKLTLSIIIKAGFGPLAHSFDGKTRKWNVANNSQYIHSMENDLDDYSETEYIDVVKAYNEYVMTSLRTMWGVDRRHLEQQYGQDEVSVFPTDD